MGREERSCSRLWLIQNSKENVVNERFIEAQLISYYQRMDIQDLVAAHSGTISDIEDGYLLPSDLGLRALFSIYCAKGKDFDKFVFKNEMKELGFNKFFAHKIFTQLEVWKTPYQKISLKKISRVPGIQTEDFQTLLYMYNNKGNKYK